jgi:hypothetical protein
MKRKLSILVILSLFFATLPAITTEGNNKIEFSFSFSKPSTQMLDGDIFRITIPELPNSNEYNKPRLPVKPVRILLPPKKDIKEIKIVTSGSKTIGKYDNIEVGRQIVPLSKSVKTISRDKKVATLKNTGGIYPKDLFSIVGVYNFRGYSILYINLYPVHYRFVTGEICYYDQMKLVITLKESSRVNSLFRGLQRDRNIVINMVDNPEVAYEYKKISGNISKKSFNYVVITNERFANYSDEYDLNKFAEYKRNKGFDVKIVTVENITSNPAFWNNTAMFNDTPAQIRNFIRYAYLNWGTDYVLLVGDADIANPEQNIIPARYLFATTGGLPLSSYDEEGYIPSDLYYACLDGNFNDDMDEKWGENSTENSATHRDEADLLAEVWVGRACVDSNDELSNFVMKTISYDQTEGDPYLGEILLIGEYLGFEGMADFGGNYKDEIKQLIPDEYVVLTLYDRDWPTFDPNNPWYSGWSKLDLIEILNKGVHIANHDGHGWTNYGLRLHNYDIDTLSNTKYCFIYSQTCLAGSFDNWYPRDNYYTDDCAAEHFTVETPHGAFAVIMNSRYGLGMENSTDAPSQRYDLAFFNAIFNKNIREIGRANHASKEDNIWRIDEPGMRWAYYETNLLGDPQLAIKHAEEIEINITIDILQPESGKIYLFNKKTIPVPFLKIPIIVGNITIKVEANSEPEGMIRKVEFYVDEKLKFVDYNVPYEYNWDEMVVGKHTINVTAYAISKNKKSKEIKVRIFNV